MAAAATATALDRQPSLARLLALALLAAACGRLARLPADELIVILFTINACLWWALIRALEALF